VRSPERVSEGLGLKGQVDLNVAIISRMPSCDLRHIFGKEKLVQVRGQTRAASSQWVRRCHWNKYICEKWVFWKGETTISHPTVSPKGSQTACVFCRPMVDQAPPSERRRRFVPALYQGRMADGSAGNTVKMQMLMQASCDKVPILMPEGRTNVGAA